MKRWDSGTVSPGKSGAARKKYSYGSKHISGTTATSAKQKNDLRPRNPGHLFGPPGSGPATLGTILRRMPGPGKGLAFTIEPLVPKAPTCYRTKDGRSSDLFPVNGLPAPRGPLYPRAGAVTKKRNRCFRFPSRTGMENVRNLQQRVLSAIRTRFPFAFPGGSVGRPPGKPFFTDKINDYSGARKKKTRIYFGRSFPAKVLSPPFRFRRPSRPEEKGKPGYAFRPGSLSPWGKAAFPDDLGDEY